MQNAHYLILKLLFISLKIPYLSKIALSLYIRVGAHRRKNRKAAEHSIFIMYEPRLEHIVRELEERGLNVLILGRGLFDYLFRKHLGEYIEKNKGNFGEYTLSVYVHYKEERNHYLRDCTCVAKLLKRYSSVSTIILPKYNDDYTLELVQAFHNSGWKTIVYDREGTVTKRRLEYIPHIVSRMAPICDYVITYNETHKAFFEKVFLLSNIPKPEIIVMGNPLSDEWFLDGKLRQSDAIECQPDRRNIVFFAFGEFSYVYDAEYLEGKDEVWRGLLTDIHQVLVDHLSDYPDDEVRYKRGPKGNRDYWSGSEKLLALPNAYLIPSVANSNKLIAEGDFIIAFQTTALIDAMHTEKIIIYCAWGDNYQELKKDLIRFDEYAQTGAILHARSPKELKHLLSLDPREVVVNVTARKKIRESFTTNPDGMVAKRFADWVVGNFLLNNC